MTPDVVADLFREALMLIILMVSVIIMPGLLVGLVISVFQAATQINEQTLSFLPRLLATLFVLVVAGPFLLAELVEFMNRLMMSIPHLLG